MLAFPCKVWPPVDGKPHIDGNTVIYMGREGPMMVFAEEGHVFAVAEIVCRHINGKVKG